MTNQVLAKEQYLAQLNAALESHSDYEFGMTFMEIGQRGFHLLDPRHLALQRGEREHDFCDAPFADAISTVRAKFELDRATIGDAF